MRLPGGEPSANCSEYLSFRADRTVGEILHDLQTNREEYSEYGVQYAYVLDDDERLLGVLPVRNLLFARPGQAAADIMIRDPITVKVDTPVDDVERMFGEYGYLGFPVVDDDGRILGIVDHEGSAEALQEAATGDLLKVQGLMGREELRSMPMGTRSRRRLSWLSNNIVLNLISASVIALHQDTLEVVIALASGPILTTVTDMCGFLLILGMAAYFLPFLLWACFDLAAGRFVLV